MKHKSFRYNNPLPIVCSFMNFLKNNSAHILQPLVFSLIVFVLIGCGKIIRNNVVKELGIMFEERFDVFTSEEDPVLAEKAIASNLKLIDVLAMERPHDVKILSLAAKSYSMYTFLFIDGKIHLAEECNLQTIDAKYMRERANSGYNKAIMYSKQALSIEHQDLLDACNAGESELKQALGAKGREIDTGVLFWLGFSLGRCAELNPDDPSVLADLGKSKVLMEAVLKKDENFFYGGPHIFLAVYYSYLPNIAGGNLEIARTHFDTAERLSSGKFLLTYYLYARYYGEHSLDRMLFEKKLNKVVEAPNNLLPSMNLVNVVVKKWAAHLLKHVENIF